jgi:hybrid cluster-associated redox disulfide protein
MTLTQNAIDSKALVDEVMRRWPATVGVFMRWRMKCVGCPFGVFHSVEHACEEHAQDLARFLAALEAAAA